MRALCGYREGGMPTGWVEGVASRSVSLDVLHWLISGWVEERPCPGAHCDAFWIRPVSTHICA